MNGFWTLRARKADLSLGIAYQDWTGILTERTNMPATLQVTGRTGHLRSLFLDGDGNRVFTGGVVLDDPAGRRFSGVLSQIKRVGPKTCTLTFKSDAARIWTPIVYPTPSLPITSQTVDYGDVRTGPAETVALGYIAANAGPSAIGSRRVPYLTIPTSAGRGPTTPRTSRLDVLGPLVAEILEPAALRFDVVQVGQELQVQILDMPDLSGIVGYGTPSSGKRGLLGDWSWTINEPDVTDAIVAGGGQGTARVFRERADAAAEALWGRRIEALVDQRQTSDLDELDKAGDDALAAGSQPVQVTATVMDSPEQRLGIDVPLGALVTLDLDGDVVVDRLRQLTTTLAVADGEPTVKVEAVVGSPDAGLTESQKQFIAQRKLRKGQAQ